MIDNVLLPAVEEVRKANRLADFKERLPVLLEKWAPFSAVPNLTEECIHHDPLGTPQQEDNLATILAFTPPMESLFTSLDNLSPDKLGGQPLRLDEDHLQASQRLARAIYQRIRHAYQTNDTDTLFEASSSLTPEFLAPFLLSEQSEYFQINRDLATAVILARRGKGFDQMPDLWLYWGMPSLHNNEVALPAAHELARRINDGIGQSTADLLAQRIETLPLDTLHLAIWNNIGRNLTRFIKDPLFLQRLKEIFIRKIGSLDITAPEYDPMIILAIQHGLEAINSQLYPWSLDTSGS